MNKAILDAQNLLKHSRSNYIQNIHLKVNVYVENLCDATILNISQITKKITTETKKYISI